MESLQKAELYRAIQTISRGRQYMLLRNIFKVLRRIEVSGLTLGCTFEWSKCLFFRAFIGVLSWRSSLLLSSQKPTTNRESVQYERPFKWKWVESPTLNEPTVLPTQGGKEGGDRKGWMGTIILYAYMHTLLDRESIAHGHKARNWKFQFNNRN